MQTISPMVRTLRSYQCYRKSCWLNTRRYTVHNCILRHWSKFMRARRVRNQYSTQRWSRRTLQRQICFPNLLYPQNDGKPRFCVDYLKINTINIKDLYPLRSIHECIDSIGELRTFLTPDIFNCYLQINVSKKRHHKHLCFIIPARISTYSCRSDWKRPHYFPTNFRYHYH